jgi:hypothetical protein
LIVQHLEIVERCGKQKQKEGQENTKKNDFSIVAKVVIEVEFVFK